MRTVSGKVGILLRSIGIALICSALVSGCSFTRGAIALLRSTDHFIRSEEDPRVFFEPGAEEYTEKIISFLPTSIRQVEEKQYLPFAEPVQIYICASNKSFNKYTGGNARAKVLTKLFLSPRVFEKGNQVEKLYLIHELSHLHLLQRLSLYRLSRLPFWFKEGLATYVSNGGGANLVSEKQAIEAMQRGEHFVPNDTGGFVFQKTPSDFRIRPQMFYRQSMMFVAHLFAMDKVKFREVILSIQKSEPLAGSIQKVYGKSIEELWLEFLGCYKNIQ